MSRLRYLVTARLSCSVTAWYVNAAAGLFSHVAFGCLVTAWLSCIDTARYVTAAVGLSFHGVVVLFSHGMVC